MQPLNVKQEGKQQNGKSSRKRRKLQTRQKKRMKADPEAGEMPESIKDEADRNGSADDKSTIYHTIVENGENVFDNETVQDYHKFKKCVKSLRRIASAVPDNDDDDDNKPKLTSGAKLKIRKRVNDKIAEVAQVIFRDRVLDPENRQLYHKMARCFEQFQAALRKAERGCVFCYLDFADGGCYDTFWRGYSDGSLSDTLTRELITDDMRAAEGGADLYIHVLHSATEEVDFSDQDPNGTADRGSPHPGPSGEHTGQGPPAPGSGNHGDDTPPGYHGDGPGELQVSGGGDVIQAKQEPAEQVPSYCMMGNVKSEIKGELAGPFLKSEETELDRQLATVADYLGSMWERLALPLGFTTDYIRDLTARQPPSLRPHRLICDWLERNLGDVTLDQLVQALRDAGIHKVADAAASGQLFETAGCSEAEKEKPEDDIDATSPGRQTSPDKGKEKGFDTSSSSEEEPDDRNAENGDESQNSTASPSLYPTGEDALAWNDCLQDFFKTDEDTSRSIQESWPSNLLVKHLIRDRFFHSYLCEYWKQYQTFPISLATFVKFVTKVSLKQSCFENDISDEHWKSVYENICLMVGKAAFESHTNSNSVHISKDQLDSDILETSIGWLKEVESNDAKDVFQFVHDSIRQFLMAVWIAHTVRTQTDCTDLLRVCAEKLDHLPITCCSLARLLSMTDSPTHLQQFVTLLMQKQGGSNDFNHLLSVVTTTAETNQLDALSPFIENLFPDKTMDLSALPEISLHGLHCLTQLIRSTTLIQTIRLPENRSIKSVLKKYPFGRKPVSNVDHANQVKYLSYLPLFECMTSTRDILSLTTKCRFAKTDKNMGVDTIHQYLLFSQSLENITVRSGSFLEGSLGKLAKSLLFTPNVTTITMAVRNACSTDLAKAMNILTCLHKLKNAEFSEYWSSGECLLTVRFGTFILRCKTRSQVWPGVLSFQPSDIQRLTLEGRHTKTSATRIYSYSAERLVSYFQSMKSLVELRFDSVHSDNSTWSILFQGLASLPHESTEAGKFLPLELLCCTNCNLISQNINALVGKLQIFPNLREIDLSHNKISDEAVPGLAEGLGSCQKLKTVNLSHNKLSDRGDFLPPLPNLEEIDLSHNAISDEAMPGLAEGLGSCQKLKKLNLSNNELSAGRGDFLHPLHNLEEIDLSHNAISDELPNLEEIDLSHNDISNEAVPGLAEGLGSCQKLKKVNLSHNKLSDRGDFLPPLPNLEEIDLSHNNISDEAMPGLAEGLGSCQNLKHVHLTDNKISNKGALMLLLQDQCKSMQIETAGNNISDDLVSLLSSRMDATQIRKLDLSSHHWRDYSSIPLTTISLLLQFLPQLPNLQELTLCVSCQGEEEAEHTNQLYWVRHLLKSLKLRNWSLDNIKRLSTQMTVQLPLLEEIDLSRNNIGDEETTSLTKCLSLCENLKKVNISYNKLSDRGDFLPPLPNLEEIDLSDNAISDEAVPALAQGLGSCQKLKKVNLSGNTLSDRGDFLPPLPNLEEIDLSHNAISDEAVPGLAEGLASCQNLRTFHITHNHISNKGALLLLHGHYKRLKIESVGNRISDDLVSLLANRKEASQAIKIDLTSHSGQYDAPLPLNAVKSLLQFLPQLPNLQELALCVSCQGEEEAEHINQLYGVRHLLKKLKLVNWSSDNMVRLSTQMFRHLSLLEEIDISDAISDEAVPGLADGLSLCENLKIVHLANNEISNKGVLVWLLLGQYKQLQLKFRENVSDDLVSLLCNRKDASQVTKLDLTSGQDSRRDVTPLRTSDVYLLLQFLPQLPNLQELALCVSCQGEEEAELTDQLYGVQPPLKTLKLRAREWSLDKMRRLLKLILKQFPLLEEIDLSSSDISDEAVPSLAEGLGSCQKLRKINISHNKLSDSGDFLPPLPNLEEIDLSHNDISDEAVPDLAKCLASCENLVTVHLRNNKISDKGVLLWLLMGQYKQLQLEFGANVSGNLVSVLCNRKDAIQVTKLDLTSGDNPWSKVTPLRTSDVHLLLQFLPQLPNLQELALCVSCQGEEEAELINQLYGVRHLLKKLELKYCSLANMIKLSTQMFQHLLLLEEIDLSYNAISHEAVPGLAKGLGSCQNLKKVNLRHNKLSGIGDFLPPLPNLEEIDLSHNVISDDAVPGVAEGLASYQKLKKVDLSYNKLSNRGDFLPPIPNMEEIDLSNNAISDEAVPGLAEGFGSCPKLKKVDLSCNYFSDVGKLMKALINLPILTHVHMYHNSIRDESLPAIAEWLKVSTAVERVDLDGNRFSAEGVRDFVRTMKGKAYSVSSDDLLYDGSLADVGEAVETGGEGARREEQQWERLRSRTGLITVKIGQLTVKISHKGPKSNNTQLASP
ncbi:uncharacterized protein LOC144907112 [Branchiostoma floridae x Branchiostoma belcheri]